MQKNRTTSTRHIDPPVFEQNYSAEWFPIYVEPITHSGERLVSGIAFRGVDGTIKVINTLLSEPTNKIFGEIAKDLFKINQLTLQELENFLHLNISLSNFTPKLSGIFIGHTRKSVDHNLEAIIDQARLTTSCLSALYYQEQMAGETPASTSKSSLEWQKEIYNKVLNRRATLKNNFNRTYKFREHALPAKIGYVGNHIAFNFESLDPRSSTFKHQRDRISSQTLELNSLRKLSLSDFTHLEVSVWTPDKIDLTAKDQKKLYSVEQEIEQLGDDLNIIIKTATETTRVENIILNDVAHRL